MNLKKHKQQLKEIKDNFKKQLTKTEDQFNKQIESYEKLLSSAVGPKTITNYNYILTNYPNAPALTGRESYKNLLESKTMTFIDVICMYHSDNKLVQFVGDYLIKEYLNKEPNKQSLWTTDLSRLTYIISEARKNGNIWSYDKKGVQTKKIIIEPILQYIRNELYNYCQKKGGTTKAHILKKMIASNEIIQTIDNGELLEKINKYIAPEFSFKISDNKSLN